MFDGVIHGFLRNVIEMRCHGVVVDQHGRFALEAAGNSEEIFDFTGPELERGHQALSIGDDRQQASRQFTCLVNRFIHQLHDLGGVGGVDLPAFQPAWLHAPWP